MRDYSETNPTFNEAIQIPETTDTNHADNINHAPVQIYENTMVLRNALLPDEYVEGESYTAGQYVLKDGVTYLVTEDMDGDWNSSKVVKIDIFTDLIGALTDITQLQKDVITAQRTADEAIEIANNAKLAADAAQKTADQAVTDAAEAQRAAESAMEGVSLLNEAILDINSTISVVPSQMGSLTYNGTSISPEWYNYNSDLLEISGETSAVNAGTYIATFTPKEGYKWNDGSTDAISVAWIIGKATPTITCDPAAITLDNENNKVTIMINYDGDGELSVTIDDESVASLDVSEKEVAVSAVGDGTASLSVSAAEGDNYFAASNMSACAITSTYSPELNAFSWAKISEISSAGEAANYWAVGDCKEIHVEGTVGSLGVNQNFYVYIMEFDHNSELEGKGITFGCFKAIKDKTDAALIDSKYDEQTGKTQSGIYFSMNHVGEAQDTGNAGRMYLMKNHGGWKACDLRYDILGSVDEKPDGYNAVPTTNRAGYDASTKCATDPVENTLMAALPEDLRSVMIPLTVYTDNVGGGANEGKTDYISASIDYLPLLSIVEIFGSPGPSNDAEADFQLQYEYFVEGNSAIKYAHNDLSEAVIWNVRSPSATSNSSNNTYWINVSTSGDTSGTAYIKSSGLAPIFRV